MSAGAATSSPGPAGTSAWSPLRHPYFRALWLAAIGSNIGTWIHDVGAAWLMTELTPSPVMVSLMATATSLPIVLLALPAGALADIVDRRRLQLFMLTWVTLASAALGVLTLAGLTTPWVLLTLTFVMGLGVALNTPAFQATVPEMVPREDMPAAISLSAVAINVARGVGPALGGFVVAAWGSGVAFLINAATNFGPMAVLYAWPRPRRESALPAERLLGAMRAGWRYARHAPPLQAVLVRAGLFMFCASSLWALLPLVGRQELRLDAFYYGLMVGCVGLGAVSAVPILPRVRRRVATDALVAGATLLFAAVILALAHVRSYGWLCLAMYGGGIAWITLMSSFNVAAQLAAPGWVQARALAVYLLVFQGGMAAGGLVWGSVASRWGIPVALTAAAAGLAGGLVAALRYRLASAQGLDLSPSQHWPEPAAAQPMEPERAPVLVTVEYHIDPARAGEFSKAMGRLSRIRLRDGALNWNLFADAADPARYQEVFLVESWLEHLRQHARGTVADLDVEAEVRQFQVPGMPVAVSHLVAREVP